MEKLLENVARFGTAFYADAMEEAGTEMRVMDRGMRPVLPFRRTVGQAMTIRLTLEDVEKSNYVGVLAEVLDRARKIEHPLFVYECHIGERAPWGDGASRFARASGCVGTVLEGFVRDTEDLRNLDYQVYARGITPFSFTSTHIDGKAITATSGQEVRVGGAPVREGDIVYGDHDGVVVFAPDEAVELLANARKMFDIERQIFERLDEGKTYLEAIGGFFDR